MHLWCAPLDLREEARARLKALLSSDEKWRLSRFRFERDRRRFLVRHGLLRLILSAYTRMPASRHVFQYGIRGKPALRDSLGRTFHFNMAHSEERFLLGLTRIGPVGTDIEFLRPLAEMDSLVRQHFSPSETATFHSLRPSARVQAFFSCWTRKEAFVKALGEGLFTPLDSFDVTLAPNTGARIVRWGGSMARAAEWKLLHLQPYRGYVGAVCVGNCSLRPAGWLLDPERLDYGIVTTAVSDCLRPATT